MKPTNLVVNCPSDRVRINLSGVYPMAPLGAGMLAASLRDAGYPVEVLDLNAEPFDEGKLGRLFERRRFDHVVLSAHLLSVHLALRIARLAKAASSKTVVSLGGPCDVFEPEQLLRYTRDVDVFARGEGERIVVAICRAIETGAEPRGIPSTAYLAGGAIERTADQPPLDMDALPRPAFDLLPLDRYRFHPPFGAYPSAQLMETTRGCPFGCNFCTLRRKLRMRSAATIFDDLVDLIRSQRIREVHIVDPTFTVHRERVLELCDRISHAKLDLHWSCKTRCDLVDEELLGAMAKAGCYLISYGVESASQEILDGLEKGLSVADIERGFELTKRARIRVLAYMLLGSPGETDATVQSVIDFIRRTRPDFISYNELMPDPTSTSAQRAIREGTFSEDAMLDYYLGGRWDAFEAQTFTGYPRSQIDAWITKAYGDFYFNPGYVVRRLLDVRSGQDFRNLVRGGLLLAVDKLVPKADSIGFLRVPVSSSGS